MLSFIKVPSLQVKNITLFPISNNVTEVIWVVR